MWMISLLYDLDDTPSSFFPVACVRRLSASCWLGTASWRRPLSPGLKRLSLHKSSVCLLSGFMRPKQFEHTWNPISTWRPSIYLRPATGTAATNLSFAISLLVSAKAYISWSYPALLYPVRSWDGWVRGALGHGKLRSMFHQTHRGGLICMRGYGARKDGTVVVTICHRRPCCALHSCSWVGMLTRNTRNSCFENWSQKVHRGTIIAHHNICLGILNNSFYSPSCLP